ncbi:MAG: anthranilate synthase component I [SAR324 cluster bacterium]|nr:anthranilate synthase component I [SAR324 cluster bacterium]
MNHSQYTTSGGIVIEKQITNLHLANALDPVYQRINDHQGVLLVSNYEYPDRYSRWDIGFVGPALELYSTSRKFTINALNKNGKLLLPLLAVALKKHPHLESLNSSEDSLSGEVLPMPAFFPEEERSKQPSIFSVIRCFYALFQGADDYLGLYGSMGYDLVFQFENITPRHSRNHEIHDCHLFFPLELYVVDRQKEVAYRLEYTIHTPEGHTTSDHSGLRYPVVQGNADGVIACDHQPGEFERKVSAIREGCRRGDFFEVVLSQSFSTGFDEPPLTLFQRICQSNPSPYTFLINLGHEHLIGASPEMYVRVENGRFETCPISGTVPVGNSPMETAEHIKQLISSEKEESELTMCTDVDRNDMSRICVPGSVKLRGRRLIEMYSRLIHTVDHVEGQLSAEYDALDAVLCHMWACTVTGSPKPIAMQTIEDLENSPREWYSGCIGVLKFNGNVSTGMTIRTIQLKQGKATVRAGATLLFDSDPALEERETRIKSSAFLEAVLGKKLIKPVKVPRIPSGKNKTVLFVDNQDSFVHTLANYVRQTEARVITLRSGFPPSMIDDIKPDLIFISPGPKTPRELGVPELVGEAVKRNIPVFGVCLGHQGMAEFFGGTLKTFETPIHGKPSKIFHNNQSIFEGLPNPFIAGRYHSLYVERETLPECLEILAETDDGVIMALRHKSKPVVTVQFHPESILSLKDEAGISLIHRVLELLPEQQ